MRDGAWVDPLHLLRHDTDIERAVAALVAESVELEAVAKPHQRSNVMLEADVGTPPPAPAPATAAAAATSTAAGDMTATAAARSDHPHARHRHTRTATAFAIALGPPPLGRLKSAAPRLPRLAWPRLAKSFALRAIAQVEGIASPRLALGFGLRLAEIGLLAGRFACLPDRSFRPC